MSEATLKLAENTVRADKAVKFRDLGSKRVNRLLKFIGQLGNLANRSSYDYSDSERAKMFASIRESLDACEARFKPKQQQEFTF
jgi:hypothetical protein